jgi:hypothetical protein
MKNIQNKNLSSSKRVTEAVTEAVAEVVSKPVAEVVSKPVAEVVSKPVAEVVSKPVAEVVSKPVAEVVSKPVAEVVSKPVAEVVSKPVAEPEQQKINVECEIDNKLDIYNTVVTHLISFDIIVIRVVPFVVASIDIQILTDTGHAYRTVNLTGDDYIKWSSDDGYLYTYTRKNIEKIF